MSLVDKAIMAKKAQESLTNSQNVEKKTLPSTKEGAKPVGRPKTGKAITMTVQVDRNTYNEFIEKCEDLGLSNSSGIRMAMKLWLKQS